MAFTILSACGSGIATSTHVATSLTEGLRERGVEDVTVQTCAIQNLPSLISTAHPSAIFAPSTDADVVGDVGDIKIFSGVPLLTGINKQALLDEVAEYLKSL